MTPVDPGSFDPLAGGYDDVATSAVGTHYRGRVDEIIDRHVPQNGRILDLGCGTGIDAARLAAAGHRVVAVDGSAEMVARAADRLAGVENAEVHQQDLDTIDQSAISGPFHLVLANFGVVNCAQDVPRLGRWLASVLDQSGLAILVTMAPICPPELLQGLVTGNRSLVGRRRSPDSAYLGTPISYFSAKGLVRRLGAGLVLEDARALGVVLPTFEQRGLVEGRPRLLRSLGAVDRLLGSPLVELGIGDHHVAVIGHGPKR